jgi:putative membrane protein
MLKTLARGHIACSRSETTMEQEASYQDAQRKPLIDRAGVAPSSLEPDQLSTELSSRRTGMSFQRTRMSADRTLMSVTRTSLSLITFGFTLAQAFRHLRDAQVLSTAAAPNHFGAALVLLGVVMELLGIGYHLAFMSGLRRERKEMIRAGFVHGQSQYPVSMILLVAIALLFIGVLAFASLVTSYRPFG